MEHKFSTSTLYNTKEYSLFYKYRLRHSLRAANIVLAFVTIILLFSIFSILYLEFRHPPRIYNYIIMLIIIYIVILLVVLFFHSYPKILYKRYTLKTGYAFYKFYDEHYQVYSKDSDQTKDFYYSKINSVYETKTHFYFINSMIELTIIVKRECSDDLISFIKNLASSTTK